MVSIPLSYGSSLTGLGLCGARKPDRTSGTIGKITATTRKSAIGPNVPSTLPRSVPLRVSIAKARLFWVGVRYGSGALRPPPPVAAALVPRFALLPAATPRVRAFRGRNTATPMASAPIHIEEGEDGDPFLMRPAANNWETAQPKAGEAPSC